MKIQLLVALALGGAGCVGSEGMWETTGAGIAAADGEVRGAGPLNMGECRPGDMVISVPPDNHYECLGAEFNCYDDQYQHNYGIALPNQTVECHCGCEPQSCEVPNPRRPYEVINRCGSGYEPEVGPYQPPRGANPQGTYPCTCKRKAGTAGAE
jgi:hypothetical protein